MKKKIFLFMTSAMLLALGACSDKDEPQDPATPEQEDMFTRAPFHKDYELESVPISGRMTHQALPYDLSDFKYPTEQVYLSIPEFNIRSLEVELYIYMPAEGGSFTLNSGREYQCITRKVSLIDANIPEEYETVLQYLCEDGQFDTYSQREYDSIKFNTQYSAIASSDLHNVTFKEDENVLTGKLEILGCSFINGVGTFQCTIAANDTGKDRIIGVYICENHCQNTEQSDNMARKIYIHQISK